MMGSPTRRKLDDFERLLLWRLRKHPEGLTAAQLAAIVGDPVAFVGVGLRDLRKKGKARTEGNTRGTRWFAVLK